MNKRYAFWRMPNGGPYRGVDGKHAPHDVLAGLSKHASVTGKGSLGISSFAFWQYESAIQNAIVILNPDGVELNENDTGTILRAAILDSLSDLSADEAVKSSKFMTKTNAQASRHFRKTVKDFVLISRLSIDTFPRQRLTINGREVAPLTDNQTYYAFPDVVNKQWVQDSVGFRSDASEWQQIRVKTSGRTIHEATDNALEALHLLRGLWTLIASFGSWSINIGVPERKAVGIIHAGPIHTLHHPGGQSVKDIYWYERESYGPRKLFRPKNGWDGLERQRRWAARRLRQLPYQSELEELIVRYVQALDHSDLEVAFLQLWSILEKITATIGGNYDQTIRRCTWIFRDSGVAAEVLNGLRARRNRYVHAAKSDGEWGQNVYAAKSFVEHHLFHLLRNRFGVDTIDEYGEQLSLPRQMNALKKRRHQVKHAIQMVKKQLGMSDEH
ncbi:hypothetical protein ACERK3_13735 [Phycisphaerales bacterium AB-hyl4]|uniref:Apea-like HEPN domain-containing protein n=1 Tax=Natronomicrosphaera hydrolytica TaxID=3242702 RepID=A0ABV4U759_9BACT